MKKKDSRDISIIIPIYNEAKEIKARESDFVLLQNVFKELIFVDGGSSDGSLNILNSLNRLKLSGTKVIEAPLGRASQMNAGAKIATGSTLLFLHIDTQLPKPENLAFILEANWGFFLVRLNNPRWPYWILAKGINFRSRVSRIGSGDQAIFVRKSLFNSVGGFPCVALMEDIALSRRLRKGYSPRIISTPVVTSARRWERGGVVRVMLLMWSLQILYVLGVSPSRLARWYGYSS